MRLRIFAVALVIVGLTIVLSLCSGCTTPDNQQTAAGDAGPAEQMPPVDEGMQEHHGEEAGHGPGMHEENQQMGQHHQGA